MSLRGGEDVPLNKHLDRLHLKAESPLPRSPSKTFPAPQDLATDGHWAIAAHGGAGAISDTASIPARYMIESGEGMPMFILVAVLHLERDRRSMDLIPGCEVLCHVILVGGSHFWQHACSRMLYHTCIRLKEFSDAFAFGQQMLRNGATAMDAVQEVLASCMHTHISSFAYRTYA